MGWLGWTRKGSFGSAGSVGGEVLDTDSRAADGDNSQHARSACRCCLMGSGFRSKTPSNLADLRNAAAHSLTPSLTASPHDLRASFNRFASQCERRAIARVVE